VVDDQLLDKLYDLLRTFIQGQKAPSDSGSGRVFRPILE